MRSTVVGYLVPSILIFTVNDPTVAQAVEQGKQSTHGRLIVPHEHLDVLHLAKMKPKLLEVKKTVKRRSRDQVAQPS